MPRGEVPSARKDVLFRLPDIKLRNSMKRYRAPLV